MTGMGIPIDRKKCTATLDPIIFMAAYPTGASE